MKTTAPFLKRGRRTQSRATRGRLVSQLLAGAWRRRPSTEIPEGLENLTTLLLKAGSGGLAWCRVRDSGLRDSPAGQSFHRAYQFHALEAALRQHSLKRVIPLLRRAGVEPVLVKGWAIARLYPEVGMRPYSDLDLCVLPDHYASAERALKCSEPREYDVDLHLGFGKFYERQADDILARSQLVELDGLEVRVLSAEDHLRFLCMHLLRHGAVRPLWLCDIAVLLESEGGNFDWDLCLSGSRRQADWVACAVGLAHQLLGVKVEGTPIAGRARNLPRWLVPSVLEEWGAPLQPPGQVAVYLRHPIRMFRGLMSELPSHWPNPIEATMTLEGPFNELPRLPFQVGHVFSRTAALVAQVPKLLGPVRP